MERMRKWIPQPGDQAWLHESHTDLISSEVNEPFQLVNIKSIHSKQGLAEVTASDDTQMFSVQISNLLKYVQIAENCENLFDLPFLNRAIIWDFLKNKNTKKGWFYLSNSLVSIPQFTKPQASIQKPQTIKTSVNLPFHDFFKKISDDMQFHWRDRALIFKNGDIAQENAEIQSCLDFILDNFCHRKQLKEKIQSAIKIANLFGTVIQEGGKQRRCALIEFRFGFDEFESDKTQNDFKFEIVDFNMNLIFILNSFFREIGNIWEYPAIFSILTQSANQSEFTLLSQMKSDLETKLDEEGDLFVNKVRSVGKEFWSSLEDLNLDPEFVRSSMDILLSILYFNNLSCESVRGDHWKIKRNLVYKELLDKILKLDEETFSQTLQEVFTEDDRSMAFRRKTSDFVGTMHLIAEVVFKKLFFEFLERINVKFITSRRSKRSATRRSSMTMNLLSEREHFGQGQPSQGRSPFPRLKITMLPQIDRSRTEQNFDAFVSMYIREKISGFYACSLFQKEKMEYTSEGLESMFPKNLKEPDLTPVSLVIDKIRNPPGIFQLLETTNKLNKTVKQFKKDLVKFFVEKDDQIRLDKKRFRFELNHQSDSRMGYDFSKFPETNKFYLDKDYKKLFKNMSLKGILEKFSYGVESVNKFYKSDVFRNLFNQHLELISVNDPVYCFGLESRSKNFALDGVKALTDLACFQIYELYRQTFPVKIDYHVFCQRYVEMLPTEQRFYQELLRDSVKIKTFNTKFLENVFNPHSFKWGFLSKYPGIKDLKNQYTTGRSKLFCKTSIINQLDSMVREYWEYYSKKRVFLISMFRKLQTRCRINKMLRIFKRNKAIAKNCLQGLVAKNFHRVKFQTLIRATTQIQRAFRSRLILRRLRLFLKRLHMIRNMFRARRLVKHTLKLRQIIINCQRRGKAFVALRRMRRYMWKRRIIQFVRENAAARRIQRTYLGYRSRRIHWREVETLGRRRFIRLADKKARIIQKNWRLVRWRFRLNKWRNAANVIRKNFLGYGHRKNFIILREGVIKIQKMFRKYKRSDRYQGFDKLLDFQSLALLKQERIKEIINMSQISVLSIWAERDRIEKETQDQLRKKNVVKYEIRSRDKKSIRKLGIQIVLLDMNWTGGRFTIGDMFLFFQKLFKKLEERLEMIIELKLTDLKILAVSDRLRGYIWGEGESPTVYGRQSGDIDVLNFPGNKPVAVSAGRDKMAVLFGGGVHTQEKTSALQSLSGEAILWPFRIKNRLTVLHIALKEKIQEVKCGLDFAVMMSSKGQVFTVSNQNLCGELGIGIIGSERIIPGKIHRIRFFEKQAKRVVSIAVGLKHVLALTRSSKLFGWGGNYSGQLGLGNNLNYSFPKLIPLKKASTSQGKIRGISCGKTSSYAILRNNLVFECGTNARLKNQRYMKPMPFEDEILRKILSKSHILRIKCEWSHFAEITYFQISRVGQTGRANQDRAYLNEILKSWKDTRLYPKLDPNGHSEMISKEALRSELERTENLIIQERKENENSMVVFQDELITYKKVLNNWDHFQSKRREIYQQKRFKKRTEDEDQFLMFMERMSEMVYKK